MGNKVGEGEKRTEPTNETTVVAQQRSNAEREKAGSVLRTRNQMLCPAAGKGPAGRQRPKTKQSLTEGGQGGHRLRQAVLGSRRERRQGGEQE